MKGMEYINNIGVTPVYLQVRLAHKHGAIGVIVYSDPADSAPFPTTYPRGKYLPCTGVQRGAFGIAHGDPETPGYPSIGRFQNV